MYTNHNYYNYSRCVSKVREGEGGYYTYNYSVGVTSMHSDTSSALDNELCSTIVSSLRSKSTLIEVGKPFRS